MTQVGLEFIARDRSRAGINSFRGNISTTTRTVQSLGRSLLAVAGVGGGFYMLGNVLRSGVTEAAAFGKQMANVSTMLSDQSMSLMPRYTQQIRAMSMQFGEGTETLTKGLYDILSASIAPAKALDVLTVSVKAAKGGMTDTAAAADAITTILNSYALDASRAADVSDKLFAIVVKGKTTFAELAPSIGKVAAIASTAGESFDDLGAVLATMTQAGVQTEIAVTSLRAIILSFLKPQSDSIEMARKYGVELNSATLRAIGLTGVIEKLRNATAEELAVIVPTSRAITGFTAAIQKSKNMVANYDFILNSLGEAEKANQKMMDDSSTKLDQLSKSWIALKATIGDEVIPVLLRLTRHMNEAAAGGNFKALIHENIAVLYEFGDSLTNLDELFRKIDPKRWPATFKQLAVEQRRIADQARRGVPEGFGTGEPSQAAKDLKLEIQRQQTLAMMVQIQKGGLSSLKFEVEAKKPSTEIKAPSLKQDIDVAAYTGQADMSARTNAQIVADTREKLASIRSMDTMTRMEKIQNLKTYMAEHGYTMAGVTEQEKLLSAEILSIQSSRMDAMKVYQAELREDMENTALYISDKYAEAARSIEGAMSGAFESMIADGASFRDAMKQFLLDVSRAFARMAADMAARSMMNAWVAPLMSGLAGGIGGMFGGGAAVGAGGQPFTPSNPYGLQTNPVPTRHSGWVPAGVPSFHGGRGLDSNEQVAVIRNDELIAPADQIVRSPFSRSGSAAPSINIFNESGRQIEQKGEPEFDGEKWVVSLVAKNISEGGSLSKLMKR